MVALYQAHRNCTNLDHRMTFVLPNALSVAVISRADSTQSPSRLKKLFNRKIHPMANNVVFIRSMRFLGGQIVAYPLLHYSSEKYALICAARGVPVRLGFKNNRVTDFLWTHAYRKDPNEYLAVANLKLLGLLNPVDVHTVTRDSMLALAQQTENTVPQANVVLMPGGGAGEFKRWDIQSFVALTTQLKSVMGPTTRFCFVMGPDEHKEAAFVQSQGRADIDIMMTRPLPEIGKMVLSSQLVVANDCGPSHIAQNAGVPYVGILHEPNPQWFWQRTNSRYVLPDDGSDNIKAVSVDNALRACQVVLGA